MEHLVTTAPTMPFMECFLTKDAWPNFYSFRSRFKEFSARFTANPRYQDEDDVSAFIDLSDLSREDVEEVFGYLTTRYEDLSALEVRKWHEYLSEKFGRYHIPRLDPHQFRLRTLRAHKRDNRLVAPAYSSPLVETFDFPVGGDLPPTPIPRWYLGRMATIVDLGLTYPELTIEEVAATAVDQIPPVVREYLPEFLSVLAGTFRGRHDHQAPMWSMGAHAVAEHLGLDLGLDLGPNSPYHVVASTEADPDGWQRTDYSLAEWFVAGKDGVYEPSRRPFLRSECVRYAPKIDWSIEVPNEVISRSLCDRHPRVEPLLASLSANELFIVAARSLMKLREQGLGVELLGRLSE